MAVGANKVGVVGLVEASRLEELSLEVMHWCVYCVLYHSWGSEYLVIFGHLLMISNCFPHSPG
jgi:hypothetical protein